VAESRETKGCLVVIEGSDGSGKATQTRLLVRRLRADGIATERIAFPGYRRSFFGRMVGSYLRGEFGSADSVDPHLAAVLYAGDRRQARERITGWLDQGKVVVCDRYVDSNKAHQAARLPRGADRLAFFKWVDRLEYQVFKMPRPDCVLFLHVPHKFAEGLIEQKGRRAYLRGKRRDAHEADPGHLRRAERIYKELAAQRRSGRVVLIECIARGELLSKSEIGERVYAAVQRILTGGRRNDRRSRP